MICMCRQTPSFPSGVEARFPALTALCNECPVCQHGCSCVYCLLMNIWTVLRSLQTMHGWASIQHPFLTSPKELVFTDTLKRRKYCIKICTVSSDRCWLPKPVKECSSGHSERTQRWGAAWCRVCLWTNQRTSVFSIHRPVTFLLDDRTFYSIGHYSQTGARVYMLGPVEGLQSLQWGLSTAIDTIHLSNAIRGTTQPLGASLLRVRLFLTTHCR